MFVEAVLSPDVLPSRCEAPFDAIVVVSAEGGPRETIKGKMILWARPNTQAARREFLLVQHFPRRALAFTGYFPTSEALTGFWTLEPRLPLTIADLVAADPSPSWNRKFRPDADIPTVLPRYLCAAGTEFEHCCGLLQSDHIASGLFATCFPEMIPTFIIMLLDGPQRLDLFRSLRRAVPVPPLCSLSPGRGNSSPLHILFLSGVPKYTYNYESSPTPRKDRKSTQNRKSTQDRKSTQGRKSTQDRNGAGGGGGGGADDTVEASDEVSEELAILPSSTYTRFVAGANVRLLPVPLECAPRKFTAVPHISTAIRVERRLVTELVSKAGHTMFPLDELCLKCVLDGGGGGGGDIDDGLQLLRALNLVVSPTPAYVTLTRIDTQITEIAAFVHSLLTPAPLTAPPPPGVLQCSATLTEEQRTALEYAKHHALTVVTGGPGTGKSRWTRELVCATGGVGGGGGGVGTIITIAPTGRAAENMPGGRTIHSTRFRVLQKKSLDRSQSQLMDAVQPAGGKRARPASSNPYQDAWAMLNDESSMLNTMHAHWGIMGIWTQVPSLRSLILLGDENQLPPFGGGDLFHDLITYLRKIRPEAIHTFTKNHRSSKELCAVAEALLEKRVPENSAAFEAHVGTYADVTAAFTACGAHSENTLVMTASNESRIKLEAELRQVDAGLVGYSKLDGPIAAETLYVGDFVVINKNCSLQKVSNGTRGRITGLFVATRKVPDWTPVKSIPWTQCPFGTAVEIRLCLPSQTTSTELPSHSTKRLQFGDPSLFSIADAAKSELRLQKDITGGRVLTIHKAQGGQADNVIIWLTTFEDIRTLYTAITRAKERVIVIMVNSGALRSAVLRMPRKIHSLLSVRLAEPTLL